MTAPDRSDELLRAMLDRRACTPLPTWLLDETLLAVEASPQHRASRGTRAAWMPADRGTRLVLIAALTALALALLGAGALTSGLLDGVLRPQPHLPAIVILPEGPTPSLAPDATTAPSETLVPPTPRPVAGTLAADTLAVVTRAGDGLRVRSAPDVTGGSRKLSPLLPTGTRLFVVGGPVTADGYDWYEVQTDSFGGDIDLYGWVAAADKNGHAWIKPTTPTCPGTLDGYALAETPPMDLLVCHGDARFEVVVQGVLGPYDTDEEQCPWSPGHGACSVEPSWMGLPIDLFVGEFETGPGEEAGVLTASVVVAPEAQAALDAVGNATDVRITIAADAPEARECRFLDAAGREVDPRARAVLDCRLRLVVRSLAWSGAESRRFPALPTGGPATWKSSPPSTLR